MTKKSHSTISTTSCWLHKSTHSLWKDVENQEVKITGGHLGGYHVVTRVFASSKCTKLHIYFMQFSVLIDLQEDLKKNKTWRHRKKVFHYYKIRNIIKDPAYPHHS